MLAFEERAQPHAVSADRRPAVLVVEDNAPLRSLYSRVLRLADFEVDTAGSGSEARALLLASARKYSCVVSDLWLPDETALDIIPPTRRVDPDLPFLLLTAEPTVETAIGAIEQGVHRYLCKPITRDRLVAEIQDAARICDASRRRRSEGAAPAVVSPASPPLDEAFAGLWLAAQPIVRASTRSVYAYELLLRSSCAALSSPPAILGAAERANRLPELAGLVRAAAARRAATLAPGHRLFVNLHPRDVVDPGLLRDDDPLLPHASRVTLEVTERDHLEGVPGVDEALRRLRAAGYRIAVDDLGAGYSGLTSLVELAPDVVKLDMSLIRGIDRDRTRARLVRAMFQLCDDLGIEVVAEGVETPSERDTLGALGCDLLQGYLYARPGRDYPEVDPAAWEPRVDER